MLHSPTSSAGMSQASNKWVTFNDMVDDAMEGGKLVARSDNSQHNLNRRRASMIDGDSGQTAITSILRLSGSCSTQDFSSWKNRPWSSFSHSTTSVSGFSSESGGSSSCFTTESPSGKNGTPVLPKPPQPRRNRPSRTERSSGYMRNSVSSGTVDDCGDIEDEEGEDSGSLGSSSGERHDSRPFSHSFTAGVTSETDQRRSEERGDCSDGDRYSVFDGLKRQGYTGWSTQVMGTGPFGWSDEILNGGGGQQPDRTQLLHPNPDIPPPVDNRQIQHSGGADQTNQHWYNRAGTWNTSPSRRFLRNFP